MSLKVTGFCLFVYVYSDKLFPALGFGAKIPPQGQVSHEFFLVSLYLLVETVCPFIINLLRQLFCKYFDS